MSTAGRAVCGVSGALFTWGKGCISDRRPRERAVCISQVVLPFEFRHMWFVLGIYQFPGSLSWSGSGERSLSILSSL